MGCGYLGTALAKKCLSMDWQVSALTRNLDTVKKLRDMGVQHVVAGKLAERDWHNEISLDQDYVVTCVGAADRSVEGYEESYFKGQVSAVEWLRKSSARSYLFTSSTSVYPQSGGIWVDENASNEGCSNRAKVLLKAENVSFPMTGCLASSYILRLAGIYGPDRHVLINKMRNGESYDGNRDRILNLIHRDDAVEAILSCFMLSNGNSGGIYNITDGTASTRGEITDWLSDKLGLERPEYLENDSGDTPNRKISNKKVLNEIDWKPNFPSYREGYEEILSNSL